ncbi:fused MFS/spermidine synthase [Arthrobacter sp. I2-34]|uniref:Fused MFS/spermidine synthase n=1 Tax=Arthrobacter hankyongi TaxID=2904801 RepID=A0ABS9LC89_9MICC|nr:fused MFS/spermidine synthase [Arthrobacter hankyongi]MCG2624290.1 fused MFS/spermidine synthase [Arthrobacter hankyongi]
MGRRGAGAGEPAGPAEGVYPISSGTAELVRDQDFPGAWLLKINGVQSSHVVVGEPLTLDFEYMRWMAALVESRWPVDRDESLRVLHLGGGACSLARYFAARYPQARQVVIEIDAKLAELVRGWFDIPRAPLVRIRVGEARAVTESLTEGSRNLVIRDVFAGSSTPQPLTTLEFTRAARRVLAPGGIYLVNCGDSPRLELARREVATIGEVFGQVAVIADPPMLKGRRFGNVVIAGSDQPLGEDPQLARTLLGGAVPARLLDPEAAAKFAGGARILQDSAG